MRLKAESVVLEVTDVSVDYKSAFEKVILRRWNETSDGQKSKAKFPNRRGRLAPDDPVSYALHDSFKYQPGHADVFRAVYEKAPHSPPRKGERLLVVDIGAGAATVAVALGKTLDRKERQRVDYLAFDPHPTMQRLGTKILEHLDAGFRSANYIKSLTDLDFMGIDRLLFTFSYVAHQKAVDTAHVFQWALLIRRAVVELQRPVELIYTTADLSGDVLLDLRQMLKQAKIRVKHNRVRVKVHRRYPAPTSNDGRIRWDKQTDLWDVRAEHWILST